MKKNLKITGISLILLMLLFMGCASDTSDQSAQTETADVKKISIQELHSQEDKILTSYALLDAKKGIYRIPISKAMELIAAEVAE